MSDSYADVQHRLDRSVPISCEDIAFHISAQIYLERLLSMSWDEKMGMLESLLDKLRRLRSEQKGSE